MAGHPENFFVIEIAAEVGIWSLAPLDRNRNRREGQRIALLFGLFFRFDGKLLQFDGFRHINTQIAMTGRIDPNGCDYTLAVVALK